ncbi:hypothetical protein ScPMuIL_016802 [Solemya velum]
MSLNTLIGLVHSAYGVCRDNWLPALFQFEIETCIRIVERAVTWEDAFNDCRTHGGVLLNDQSTVTFQDEDSLLSKTSREKEISQSYWIGLHRKSYYQRRFSSYQPLTWDGMPPSVRSTGLWAWNWDWAIEPPNDQEDGCGSAQFFLSQAFNDFEYGLYDTNVSLSFCNQKKPFICQSDHLPSQPNGVFLSSSCPGGWVTTPDIPTCYKVLYEERETYNVSRDMCQKYGGELAKASSSFELKVVKAVALWFASNDDYYIGNEISSWIDVERSCSLISSNVTKNTFCYEKHAFMCQIGTQHSDTLEVSIRTGNSDNPEVNAVDVTCILSRLLKDDEAVYIFRNGYLIDEYKYQTVVPYQVTVQVLSQYIEDESISVSDIGYYWCAVLKRSPYQLIRSSRTIVKYSYKDVLAFQGIAKFAPSASIPSKNDIIYFNLFNKQNEVTDVPGELTDGPGELTDGPGEVTAVPGTLNDVNSELTSTIRRATREFEFRSIETEIQYMRLETDSLFVEFTVYLSTFRDVPFNEPEILEAIQDHLNSPVEEPSGRKKRQTGPVNISMELYSTEFCPRKQASNGLYLPQTRIGERGDSFEFCLKDNEPLVSAECTGDYYTGCEWGQEVLKSDCPPFDYLDESVYTPKLKNLSQIEVTDTNGENIANLTTVLTEDADALKTKDVVYVSTILRNLAELDTVDPKVLEDILTVADNMLKLPQTIIDESREIASAPTRIVEAVEKASEKLDPSARNVKIVRENLATQIWRSDSTGRGLDVIGLKLINDSMETLTDESLITLSTDKDVTYPTIEVALVLPSSVLVGKRSGVELVMHVYNTDKFFITGGSGRGKANSKIIAAKILKDGDVVTDLGQYNMTTIFQPIMDQEEPICGYWNYTANDAAGGWQTDGCFFDGHRDGRAVCKCDHLTNFAILLDFYGDDSLTDEHKLALHIITMIGVCLSIVGLSLTVLCFIFFRKMRIGRSQQTLFNLALSLLCSLIVFVAGISEIEDRNGCIAVAALLHYFILVSFMWMLMEAILQYLRFVKVLGTYIPNFMWKTAIPAWGLPLLPVAVICAVNYELYYGGYDYCWMSLEPFYYAFALPVGIIILINLIVFVVVIVNLFRRPSGLRSNQTETQRQVRNLKASITVFVLLGLTWVFGYLAIEDARLVFKYIFCVVGTLQGFLIFVLFTAREKTVRNFLLHHCCCKDEKEQKYKKGDKSYDSSGSSSLTNTTNSTGIEHRSTQR